MRYDVRVADGGRFELERDEPLAAGEILRRGSMVYKVLRVLAKDFEPTQWIQRKQARRMDRFAQMIRGGGARDPPRARIYAELAGCGVSSDAQHLTEPDPSGQSQVCAMRMALPMEASRPTRSTTSPGRVERSCEGAGSAGDGSTGGAR
jgi:hypothetical protein